MRVELVELFGGFGLPESRATPEYPFVALDGSPLWEVVSPDGLVPKAHSSEPLTWLNEHDSEAGLPADTYDRLAADAVERGNVVGEILNRFFKQEPADALLRAVGLLTAPKAPEGWMVRPGDVARRRTIHELYGGQEQGGISTPKSGERVLLFVDPTGADYGYDYDGWKDDGSYHYTGQGRVGDQRFTAQNRAVLDPGREVHLFESAGDTVVRYVGRFEPDQEEPYYRADTLDGNDDLRSAIVFRLWPVDASNSPESATHVAVERGARLIPLEAHNTPTYTGKARREPTVYERREAKLVGRYVDWLVARGQQAMRNAIPQVGQPHELRTDLFNTTTNELVEAKGAATRDDVRLALGQLLDYRRGVRHERLAVLLPVRPAEDLVELLTSLGITCIYETEDGGFNRVEPPLSAQ